MGAYRPSFRNDFFNINSNIARDMLGESLAQKLRDLWIEALITLKPEQS
jgi:hypothetical protein